VPKRALGDRSQARIQAHARAQGVTLMVAAQSSVDHELLPAAARRSLLELLDNFARWRTQMDSLDPAALTQLVLEESGYLHMLQSSKDPENASRLDNLAELVRALEDFADLHGFLEHVALVMENDRSDNVEKVTLMTMHAAKGLEFGYVFLPGWEEGLFPNQRALDEGGTAALEEERRLAYVGITRAKRRATILHAANRRVYGQWTATIPSRFLDELPPEHVEAETTMSGHPRPWFAASTHALTAAPDQSMAKSPQPDRRPRPTANAHPRPEARAVWGAPRADIEIDGRVFHDKFGMGTVIGKTGNKLKIAFDQSGTKMVLDSFVKPA